MSETDSDDGYFNRSFRTNGSYETNPTYDSNELLESVESVESIESNESVESFHEDASLYQLFSVDGNSILSTLCDMTSLASLILSDVRDLSQAADGSIVANKDDNNRLTLAYERLHTVPKSIVDRFGPTIKILDISHNKIGNLDFLVHFKNLNSLIVDNNNVNESTILPDLPKLELLWFNHCKIKRLHPWIKHLHQSCSGLKFLSMMGNAAAPSYLNGGTFYEYLQYRLYVISLFESLLYLDDRPVTQDQQAEAKRLYKRPLLERLSIFSNKEFPFSVALKCESRNQWKFLHQKMAFVFESMSNMNNPGPMKNFLI